MLAGFARSGLAVERQGAMMLTEALANGQFVRLMMDTGASHSALTTERLRRLWVHAVFDAMYAS